MPATIILAVIPRPDCRRFPKMPLARQVGYRPAYRRNRGAWQALGLHVERGQGAAGIVDEKRKDDFLLGFGSVL